VYKLNRRVTIRRWTTIKNEFGGLTAVEVANWSKWAEVRASNWVNLDIYNTRSGNINNDYQQGKWEYDATIILRYEKERPTRSNDTIEYDGSVYNISSISIYEENAKNFEVLKCTKIDSSINDDAPLDTGAIQVYNYTGIGGEVDFTDSILIGKHVFGCYKDGILFTMITTGIPIGKQVLYTDTTGKFTWGIQFEEEEIATILYY